MTASDGEMTGPDAEATPRAALPEDDLVFFLLDVMPQLDLSPFHRHYAQEMRGQPPFFDVRATSILESEKMGPEQKKC